MILGRSVTLVLLATSLALLVSCGSGSTGAPPGPCNMPVIMSCNGGSSCHEYYTQAAADRDRSACAYFGETISTTPCPSDLPDCCYSPPDGDSVCLPAGGWNTGTLTCTFSGDVLCKR